MMGGATAPENETTESETAQNETPENASEERRPSLVSLQNMLKRVSQSPFHTHYKTLVSSTSDSSEVSGSEPQSKGDGGPEMSALSQQIGGGGASATRNLFYEHYLESTATKLNMEDGRGTAEGLDMQAIFAPPSEFQSVPLDFQEDSSTLQNGGAEDPNLQEEDFSQTTSGGLRGQSPQFQDVFRTSRSKTSNPFTDQSGDSLQAYTQPGLLPAATSAREDDLLDASIDEIEDRPLSSQPKDRNPFLDTDLFHAKQNGNTEQNLTAEADLLQSTITKQRVPFNRFSGDDLDIFSPLSSKSVDPFPSLSSIPTSPEDNVFGLAAFKQVDPFSGLANGGWNTARSRSSVIEDVFETTPFTLATQSDSHEGPSEMPPPSNFHRATPVKPLLATSSGPHDILLTTPHGTNRRILQPTPFSQAGLSPSPPSPTSDESPPAQVFKRPPKPLPRTRPARPVRPLGPTDSGQTQHEPKEPLPPPSPPNLPTKPVPKPLPRQQLKKDLPKVDPEDFVVLEDVLLIGQERCVEDWPEDSPQLRPDFKPAGRLRLRRESMLEDSDGGSGERRDGSSLKKRDWFNFSTRSRTSKNNKDKTHAEQSERRRTLPILRRQSQESFTDKSEQEDGLDYKSKKPMKDKVGHVLRRASTSVIQSKHANGRVPQAIKENQQLKNGHLWLEQGAASSGMSSGEGELGGQDGDNKMRKKLKLKFVPRRGFSIMVEKGDMRYSPQGQTGDKHVQGKHPDKYLERSTGKKWQDEQWEDKEEGAVAQSKFSPGEEWSHTDRKASASMADDDEGCCMSPDCKPEKAPKTLLQHPGHLRSKVSVQKGRELDEFRRPRAFSGEEPDAEDDGGMDYHKSQKKKSKLKGLKKHKSKSKFQLEDTDDPPGATSSDYYMSEAAQAEWLAAQKDERAVAGMLDEEEEGDTDSLMEWWNTVEQWDEVPSDEEEKDLKEDESKSFTILAEKVQRGLCVFNKIFTERAEVLWQSIITLHTIADDILVFHQKARIAGITGGTTTAVGSVAAIAGLALAPATFGATLLVTAVGVGVAAAGGITSASAAISDNVNNTHDRKKVEILLKDYEAHLLDISKVLHFVDKGIYKLRGHPFLRSGTQHYSEEWEIRQAVQMIGMVDQPIMRAVEVVDSAVSSVQGLFQGMDKYFIKDSRELKKGYKTDLVAQIKEVANVLNDSIVDLNAIREELQEAHVFL